MSRLTDAIKEDLGVALSWREYIAKRIFEVEDSRDHHRRTGDLPALDACESYLAELRDRRVRNALEIRTLRLRALGARIEAIRCPRPPSAPMKQAELFGGAA